MPAYKYTLKNGKTMWYANFYYTDWTGKRKHICKRGFKTQREAKEYERSFMYQEKNTSDILFSSLVENYMEDMAHRLKPTTMENKRFIIQGKLLPYFGNLKVCDIDTIKVRKWQNELISYRNDKGKPFSPTYLKTVNNQLSALLNYAVSHYQLLSNPCRAAGSIGKSNADEMHIWTQEQYEQFTTSQSIRKDGKALILRTFQSKCPLFELGVFFVVLNYIYLSSVQIHAVFYFNYIIYSGLLIFCCQNVAKLFPSIIYYNLKMFSTT